MSLTVDVANGLSAFLENSLSFGTIVAGTGTHSVAATDASAGLFRIFGQKNRTVNVTLTPPATLSNGTNTIPYTWQASYNSTALDPSLATAAGATTFTVSLKANLSGTNGNAYVWTYGSVNLGTAPSSLTGGNYTGNFVISVAY